MKKLLGVILCAAFVPASSGCKQFYVGEYTANAATGEIWYIRWTKKVIPVINPAGNVVAQDLYYCAPANGPVAQDCYRAEMPGVKSPKKK